MRTYLSVATIIVALLMTSTGASAQGVDVPSAELPPPGQYISPQQYHEYAAMGIILDDPMHKPITDNVFRTPDGNDEIETFDSVFDAVEIGLGLGPITLTGPVEVRTRNRLLSTAGLFDTEIVSMSLSGNTPMGLIMIREDPTRASTGQTDILDLGGGLYHIDSFFDVFTELSVDGGASWIASDYGTRMYLVPEPGTIALLTFGGATLLLRRRR
jgi:hypothetical protein